MSQDHVKSLIEKADATDALRLSQAAKNAAEALHIMTEVERQARSIPSGSKPAA